MKVTVCIVTHARPALLRNTLRSIVEQDWCVGFPPFEILLVDDGDETGSLRAVFDEFPHRTCSFSMNYLRRNNRKPELGWANAAVPLNMAIKAASGDVIVMHSGDVMYTSPTDLFMLLKPLLNLNATIRTVSLATCEKIGEADGVHYTVHARSQRNLLYTFGCAFNRAWAIQLGGIEESYEGWGHDEEDFARVMLKQGAQVNWLDVLTHHQFHEWVPASRMNTQRDIAHFRNRCAEIEAGHLSNEGREWGIDR